MLTYLWGRSVTKFALATLSVLILLLVGWFLLHVRWDWGSARWVEFTVALVLGLTATMFAGFLMAGFALLLPRVSISLNEGVAVALYLLCGVIFPIDLLPRVLQWVAMAFPFTWWYEALRRFLLGQGASEILGRWSDGAMLAMLAITTVGMAIVALVGYRQLENRARQLGRLDQSTLF
jgi:ABC-2 type transport system permease protein